MKCDLVKNYDAFHKIISILNVKMIKYNLLFVAFSRYAIHNPVAGFFRPLKVRNPRHQRSFLLCAPALSVQKLFLST
ncbi:hypothetical protein ACUXF8_001259 [Pantoea piersonii]